MKTLKMYGSSDDLVEASGVDGADEFMLYNEPIAGSFVLGGKMRIYAIYDGCWSFAVGQIEEEITLPNWPIRITASPDCNYSMQLEIDVPDDAVLVLEQKR